MICASCPASSSAVLVTSNRASRVGSGPQLCKTTFMKILAGVLESSAGNVSMDPGERMAYLKQDQFAYEEMRVIDVVMMGHAEMWAAMRERDAIYATSTMRADRERRARANLTAELASLRD